MNLMPCATFLLILLLLDKFQISDLKIIKIRNQKAEIQNLNIA